MPRLKHFTQTYRLTDLLNQEKQDYIDSFKKDMFYLLNLFNDEFISKKIEYFFKTQVRRPQEVVSLTITSESVMHLFGISYYAIEARPTPELFDNPSFSKEFFTDFQKEQLNLKKCWVESIDKVKNKMEVLMGIPNIKTENVRIGCYGTLRSISMTNTLRDSKTFLGLGLYHESKNSIPRTCLNLKNDTEARDHPSFSNVYKCSKIIEYTKLPNGNWKRIKQDTFNINSKKKKRKNSRKSKTN